MSETHEAQVAEAWPTGRRYRWFDGITVTEVWPDDPRRFWEAQQAGRCVGDVSPVAAVRALRRLRGIPWYLRRGWLYRPIMRASHRLGWCHPRPVPVEQGFVHCDWCGLRGRRPNTASVTARSGPVGCGRLAVGEPE